MENCTDCIEWVKKYRELVKHEPISELEKHASISRDNRHYCSNREDSCYCCICWDELKRRKEC